MRLKNPGGELAWLTPLLAIGGLYLGYDYWQRDSPILAVVFASVGVLSLLVWFDHKWVAIPLTGYFLLALLGGITLMVRNGFSWGQLARLALVVYTIYGLWEWRNRPDDTMSDEYVGVE